MRLNVNFLSPQVFSLPKDYRRYFISLLKKIFTQTGLYQNLYEEKKFKPYTFSAYLGEKFEIEEEKVQIGENLFLIFSSGDPIVLANFYNGLLEIKRKGEEIPLGEKKVNIGEITLLPQRKINFPKVLFRTIGVSVLSNPEASAKEFKEWYLLPIDDLERFNNVLRERTKEKYKHLNGEEKEIKLTFQNLTEEEFRILKTGGLLPANFEQPIKETVVEHYGGYVRGFRGVFWLTGDPEILQFIYDYGFGVRTGQGFGCVEIITQVACDNEK
ncbi:MAG: CRISPR-associated endoribonuclease Cas6 [candidate division WOR-3 bacterium]